MGLQEIRELGLSDAQDFGGFASHRIHHTAFALHHFRKAEHIAGKAKPKDDFLAARGGLINLDAAAAQKIDVLAGGAGMENQFVFCEAL
mgnify:CR=1 FL=1